jgi:phosphoenolpyruvate carboxykinase (ATP)
MTASQTLDALGLTHTESVHWNLSPAELYEYAVRRGEAHLADAGPLVALTVPHTGRSPKDRWVVRDASNEAEVWWGANNQPFPADKFEPLFARLRAYVQGRKLFVQDLFGGADERYRLPVRIVTEFAWHSLFARNLLIRPTEEQLVDHEPQFTVIDMPGFRADPEIDRTGSETFIVVNFERRLVLIGGTRYAGEMKKSVFAGLNYILPPLGVLPMHCSANVGEGGDVALFFGLSGTGKTTLSTDPTRPLIGDDEHGWSDKGIFNFEGGCYAKTIKLSAANEPEIYQTTRRFGTVLENVPLDPHSRSVDLDSEEITENTRGAYPLTQLTNVVPEGIGSHPHNIVFLAADAFGVLPPIARLTRAQAMYHFLLGYTARVAGTERGVTEPEATFSACFGAPFLPRSPGTYAALLGEKLDAHDATVWLVNTGWMGGSASESDRISLPHTRAIIRSALSGDLENVEYATDAVFGLNVPTSCPNVPPAILDARSMWNDTTRYDVQAEKLANLMHQAFASFEADVAPEVRDAAPLAGRPSM